MSYFLQDTILWLLLCYCLCHDSDFYCGAYNTCHHGHSPVLVQDSLEYWQLLSRLWQKQREAEMMPGPICDQCLKTQKDGVWKPNLLSHPCKSLLQGASVWSLTCWWSLMLAGAVVNSISLLPHRDLKKMKEMPAEKACEGKTKGCSHLCCYGNCILALGWEEGQTHCFVQCCLWLLGNPRGRKAYEIRQRGKIPSAAVHSFCDI